MNIKQHTFALLPQANVPRSTFKRDHLLKTTLDVDYLVPIYVDEALPGDTFQFRQHLFGRLSTPVVPIMDNLYLDTFYFAVPVRLLDKDWEKFMGARPFGDLDTVYQVPQLDSGAGVAAQSLSDYLGVPINVPNLKFCAYWHRAYNLIYNEWFRDGNLCPPRPIAGVEYDGQTHTETLADYILMRRCKRHDYYTSCLPWPQRGDPVSLSLAGYAPVRGNGQAMFLTDGTRDFVLGAGLQSSTGANSQTALFLGLDGDGSSIAGDSTPNPVGTNNHIKQVGFSTSVTDTGLLADLSNSSPVTINQLREAFAIQRLLEVDARYGGSRYIEIIRGHFGVISPDARMQRPELLGASSQMLNVTTVPQTSSTDDTSPQGNLAAFVTCRNEQYWSKSFTEHCVILGLANIRADLSYQQGLPRMFQRKTRYDFYWPELANLGEQPVLNSEIYAQGSQVLNKDGTPVDDDVFGYQERWAEYRYHPSMITGKFRSTYAQSLDVWHLAQEFASLPKLNKDFIEEHVPIDRVLAVADEPDIILDGYFKVRATRPMPLYSIPSVGSRL